MPTTDCSLARAAAPLATLDRKLVCVIGTADVLHRHAAALAPLAGAGRVQRVDWRLDDDFGEPPVAADWADGFIVLNSDAWAAPTGCARLQALLKMAWRCGRTVLLCGEALNCLTTLGFPADGPAEAEGLFLCAETPCAGTWQEFLDALQAQPHRGR